MKVIENPQLNIKRKLPWFIDALFYPTSLHSLIYIGIFLFTKLLIDLLNRFVLNLAGGYGAIFAAVLYVLLVGYIFYYFAYCIVDSSKGNFRAPDISLQYVPDKQDCFSQLLCVLGCIAISFWPAAVYYVCTERADSYFWLLLAGGIFFFPMFLLTGIMFDDFNALNPLSIISSILKTFIPYLGLLIFICVIAGLVLLVIYVFPKSPFWRFLSNAPIIYLFLVIAHLLGRFYWWHKHKLNWGL